MPSSSLWSISSLGTALGLLLLVHAAYSCWHYRTSLLILLEEADETTTTLGKSTTTLAASSSTLQDYQRPPPIDVIWELVVAFALCLLTQITPSTLRPVGLVVTTNSKKQSGVTNRIKAPLYQSREFDIYATRAKALANITVPDNKSK